jgi:stress-induced morphogen
MPGASEAALQVVAAGPSAPVECTDPTHDHSHGAHHHGHADEKPCTDPTHDHSHGTHHHGHAAEKPCTDPTHDHSHSHDHGHKEAAVPAVVTGASLEAKLRAAMAVEFVACTDESDGCGSKFNVVVVSSAFEGRPPLARHRAVNSALAAEIAQIHAITLKTLTPAQWAAQQPASAP